MALKVMRVNLIYLIIKLNKSLLKYSIGYTFPSVSLVNRNGNLLHIGDHLLKGLVHENVILSTQYKTATNNLILQTI